MRLPGCVDLVQPEIAMKLKNSDPKQAPNEPKFPLPGAVNKQVQREKAEVKEVAGRHKNDGPIGHKGRQ